MEYDGSYRDAVGCKTNRRSLYSRFYRPLKRRQTSEEIIHLIGDVALKTGNMSNAISTNNAPGLGFSCL